MQTKLMLSAIITALVACLMANAGELKERKLNIEPTPAQEVEKAPELEPMAVKLGYHAVLEFLKLNLGIAEARLAVPGPMPKDGLTIMRF